jgi:hypothetical protein
MAGEQKWYGERHDPPSGIKAVTAADGTDLPDGVARGIHLNAGGNVAVRTIQGDTPTLTLAAGRHSMFIDRILSTGTTVADANIFALY